MLAFTRIQLEAAGRLSCYLLAIVIALYNWGPLVDAKWGIIDDHEIMHFVGTSERTPLSNFLPMLEGTEIGRSSTLQRFRPSYYTLRILESMAWGKSAALWYCFRIFIAALMGITLTLFCLRFAGPIVTFGFLCFVLFQPYWADFFTSAGPAETYCVLGVCLIALGWGARSRADLSLKSAIVISLGILIAAGSKENFVLLGVLPFWLLFSSRVRTTPASKMVFVCVLGFLAWIAISVYYRLKVAGTDVYTNDVSFISRARLVLSFFSLTNVQVWIGGLLIMGLLYAVTKRSKPTRDLENELLAPSLMPYIFVIVALLAIYGAQFVFYGGNWPANVPGRYLFPGTLTLHFAVLLGAVFLIKVLDAYGMSPVQRRLFQAALSFAFISMIARGLPVDRAASLQKVEITHSFDRNLNALTAYLKVDSSVPLIINSHNPVDYEPIVSINRFLKANGVVNPIAIRMDGYSANQYKDGTMQKIIAERIQDGFPALHELNAIPISQVSKTNCVSAGMTGPFLPTCRAGVNIWPIK